MVSHAKMAHHYNKAVYTAASVACGWAGTHICSPFSFKCRKTRSDYGRTDGPTDRHSYV